MPSGFSPVFIIVLVVLSIGTSSGVREMAADGLAEIETDGERLAE